MRTRSRIWRNSVLAVAALSLAGACGKAPTEVTAGPPSANLLSQAADTTRGANTGKFAGEISTSLSRGVLGGSNKDGSVDTRMTFSGDYDLARRQQHMFLTITEYRESGPSTSSSTAPPAPGDQFEILVDGDWSYDKATAAGTVKLIDGKQWKKRTRRASEWGDAFNELYAFEAVGGSGIDPAALFDQLKAVSENVTEAGAQNIRGVDARHFRASISLSKLFDHSKRSAPATSSILDIGGGDYVGKYEQCERKQYEGKTMPVDAFVDGNNYLRRLWVDFDLTDLFAPLFNCFGSPGTTREPDAAPAVFKMSQRVDFFDFGQPVTISIPDPTQFKNAEEFKPVGSVLDSTSSSNGTIVHRSETRSVTEGGDTGGRTRGGVGTTVLGTTPRGTRP